MGKVLATLPTTATVVVGTKTEVGVSVGTSSGVAIDDKDLGLSPSLLFKLEVSDVKLSATLSKGNLELNATEAGTYTVSVYGKCKVDYSVEGPTLLGEITVTVNDA